MKELGKEDASLYSEIVTRGTYLSIDGSNIGYGVTEVARIMSKPSHIDYRQW